jgi:type I restriction enzyme S subunit
MNDVNAPELGEAFERPVRSYKRYPEYRDSGIEWLGEVPRHWTVAPVYARYAVELGKMLDAKRITGKHLMPYLRNVDVQWDHVSVLDLPEMDIEPAERLRYTLKKGDVLICEGGEVGRAAIWEGELDDCAYQKALHRVRPESLEELPRFLLYVMRSVADGGVFAAGANANTIDHLTATQLRHHRLPFPPGAEQRAIATFLDRETGRLDELISKKERLIELLQEKRSALITRAVTKGLDPNVPMRDSGIEWLGEIPAHWQVERNRWLFRESSARSRAGEEELLTVSHITGVTRRSEKNVTMMEAESHEGYKLCEQGDLVINTMWGWMGALGIAPLAGMVSPSYNVYRVGSPLLLPSYYEHLSRCAPHVTEIATRSKGVWSSRLRLYPEAFAAISTPLPPLDEQSAIAASILPVTKHIARISQTVEEAIAHLKELRSALITAAVTGKIDVRGEV